MKSNQPKGNTMNVWKTYTKWHKDQMDKTGMTALKDKVGSANQRIQQESELKILKTNLKASERRTLRGGRRGAGKAALHAQALRERIVEFEEERDS